MDYRLLRLIRNTLDRLRWVVLKLMLHWAHLLVNRLVNLTLLEFLLRGDRLPLVVRLLRYWCLQHRNVSNPDLVVVKAREIYKYLDFGKVLRLYLRMRLA
jgi:hypothetical protein